MQITLGRILIKDWRLVASDALDAKDKATSYGLNTGEVQVL